MKLPLGQLALYKRIDEILFFKWDPIGISDSDWSRDEYQMYLPVVFKLAMENTSFEPIANYLTYVTVERMELSPAKEHDSEIARLIMLVKEECLL